MTVKIGILGTGEVGLSLGTGFIKYGHEVKLGTRNPKSEVVAAWLKTAGPKASAGTFADAASFSEIAVLATKWTGTENAIQLAKPENLAGKIVIDVTNPLLFNGNGGPGLALGHTDSGGEQVQRWLPKSHVVKTLNIVSAKQMVNPKFEGGTPDMFVCGNDEKAKAGITDILRTFGWPVIDLGGIEGARMLEPLVLLWVNYGMKVGRWDNAFKLVHT